MGPAKNLPDAVTLVEPKPEGTIEIRSEHKDPPVQAIPPSLPPQAQQQVPVQEGY